MKKKTLSESVGEHTAGAKYADEIIAESSGEDEVPQYGVLELDLDTLGNAGISVKRDGNKLLFWTDPNQLMNEEFSELSVALVNSADYNGAESFMMFDVINKMALNIRLIQVLQGDFKHPVVKEETMPA